MSLPGIDASSAVPTNRLLNSAESSICEGSKCLSQSVPNNNPIQRLNLPTAVNSPKSDTSSNRVLPAASTSTGIATGSTLIASAQGHQTSSLADRLSRTISSEPTSPRTHGVSTVDSQAVLQHVTREPTGSISNEAPGAEKKMQNVTHYHFIPSQNRRPLQFADTPKNAHPQSQNKPPMPTPPPRPTPPQKLSNGKSRETNKGSFARRRVLSAPEPERLQLTGLSTSDLVGGAVGQYVKLEARHNLNGRPVYKDRVREDRYVYYLSEYGGIWSIGFTIGSKAVALFNRCGAKEPYLVSTPWSKYVGRTEKNTAKFAVDPAVRLMKINADNVLRQDLPKESVAQTEGMSMAADESIDTDSRTVTPEDDKTMSSKNETSQVYALAAQPSSDVLGRFLQGDGGHAARLVDHPILIEEIAPPLPQLQSGHLEDVLCIDDS